MACGVHHPGCSPAGVHRKGLIFLRGDWGARGGAKCGAKGRFVQWLAVSTELVLQRTPFLLASNISVRNLGGLLKLRE